VSRFLTYANAELPNAAVVIHFCIEQGEIQGDITPSHGVVTWTGRYYCPLSIASLITQTVIGRTLQRYSMM
jgi:hypothetical protein